jgi:CAI-1 autoinducer synthase
MQALRDHPATVSTDPPISAHLSRRIDRDFTTRWKSNWDERFIMFGKTPGPNAVRLDSNDYLSLSGHPSITQAQVDCLRTSDQAVIQSAVFMNDQTPTRQFERQLANFVGKSDGHLCQSGYCANVGLLQSVADPRTPVYVDTMAHTSLWEGVRASGATGHAFRHNDPDHLDRLLKRQGPGLVVLDSVYSTTGAMAPLVEMVNVAERHGSMILVDESHSLATHGPLGAGLCAELGLTPRVHFITASLAKGFAGRAGFFTVPKEMKLYVMGESFPNIFSSALLPHEVVALQATLEVVKASDDARARLRRHTRRVRTALLEQGYPVFNGSQQIIALEAGTEADTITLRDALEAHDIHGALFCAPATSRNRALVRLTLQAGLTEAEIEHVVTTTAALAPTLKPWDWPIARRAKLGSN